MKQSDATGAQMLIKPKHSILKLETAPILKYEGRLDKAGPDFRR